MRISIPLDLSSRPFIPLPRFICRRRPLPLLAHSMFLLLGVLSKRHSINLTPRDLENQNRQRVGKGQATGKYIECNEHWDTLYGLWGVYSQRPHGESWTLRHLRLTGIRISHLVRGSSGSPNELQLCATSGQFVCACVLRVCYDE
jgi:hypothetical protein